MAEGFRPPGDQLELGEVYEEPFLECAQCARDYPADENYYEPFCSAECQGYAESEWEGYEGEEDTC